MIDSINESKGQYTSEKQKETLSTVYDNLLQSRISEFNNMISNLEAQAKEASEKTNA
jgi:membrane protease subunit (stomatin/prohibitin family)